MCVPVTYGTQLAPILEYYSLGYESHIFYLCIQINNPFGSHVHGWLSLLNLIKGRDLHSPIMTCLDYLLQELYPVPQLLAEYLTIESSRLLSQHCCRRIYNIVLTHLYFLNHLSSLFRYDRMSSYENASLSGYGSYYLIRFLIIISIQYKVQKRRVY